MGPNELCASTRIGSSFLWTIRRFRREGSAPIGPGCGRQIQPARSDTAIAPAVNPSKRRVDVASLLIPTTWRTRTDVTDWPHAKCLVSGRSHTTRHVLDGPG
jgi:hypothetical protein